MIKTPIEFDNQSGDQCIYDASGVAIAFDLSDGEMIDDLVMRINLHDELVSKLNEVLSLHGSDYVSEQSHTGEGGDIIGHVIGFELLDFIEQLLEKCK